MMKLFDVVTYRGKDHITSAGDEVTLCGKLPPKEYRSWPYRTRLNAAVPFGPSMCSRCRGKFVQEKER